MTQAQRIIAEMYMSGIPIREIATVAGVTPGSAKVIASRMGLRRGHSHEVSQRRKPFRKIKFSGKDKHERQWGGF